MKILLDLEKRMDDFRKKHFSSGEFLLLFYFGISILVLLLCIPYRLYY